MVFGSHPECRGSLSSCAADQCTMHLQVHQALYSVYCYEWA